MKAQTIKFSFLCLLMACFVYAQEDQVNKLRAINFVQEGEVSKLILDFEKSTYVERVHIPDDKQIIVDIKSTQAGEKLLRGIDASEFTGPVVYISPYVKDQENLRIAIQLRDNVRSILERRNNRVILNIENRFGVFSENTIKEAKKNEQLTGFQDEIDQGKIQIDQEEEIRVPKSNSISDILENLTLSGVKKYVGKKITINVTQVPYSDILRMISEISGFNIIIDEKVNTLPPLTVRLTNISWDEALDTILSLGDLVAQKNANILTVKTRAQALAEKQAELDAQNNNVVQEPLVTRIFAISFADPQQLIPILKDYLTQGRGAIQVDQRTSQIIVKDTATVIERIKKIVETLDTQTPQVLIEAKIVEANEEYELKAGLGVGGISLGYDALGADAGTAGATGSLAFSSVTSGASSSFLTANITSFRRLTNLNFQLELMESESKGKIISSPRVITQNNQQATITSTDTTQISVTQVTAAGATQTFQPLSAAINLAVTPKVTNDGSISMNIQLSKGSFTSQPAPDTPPNTSDKQIQTNVLVDNGSTVVIGGLYQMTTREIESGIPFLKDLPLFGWLFRSAYNPSKSRSELIVFITPRVINQEEAGLVNRSETL